jgi:glycosyltransferase involved in cell wall biosynthesis
MSLSLLERARRSGTPAVGVVGDDWMLYGPTVDAWTRTFARPGIGSIAGLLTGIPAERRFGRAARWLFISETLRRRAADAGRAPASAEVVRRGPDERFGPAPAADWGGRLLYAGRIDPRKGIATAIDALALIDSRASLTIDGDGDPRHRAELEARARAAGVDPRVTFEVSPRDQVPDAYAAADAVVFPVAWEEPWGLVPLEAMAVGRPVVATGAGGSGEYLRGDENCLMFEPGDASGLAAAIGRLASEPELRDRLRAAGFETAARFGERSFNDRIERVLAEEAASE